MFALALTVDRVADGTKRSGLLALACIQLARRLPQIVERFFGALPISPLGGGRCTTRGVDGICIGFDEGFAGSFAA